MEKSTNRREKNTSPLANGLLPHYRNQLCRPSLACQHSLARQSSTRPRQPCQPFPMIERQPIGGGYGPPVFFFFFFLKTLKFFYFFSSQNNVIFVFMIYALVMLMPHMREKLNKEHVGIFHQLILTKLTESLDYTNLISFRI